MAFTNGQPWRIQPWNTEQDSETLGPWTSAGLSLPTGVNKIGKHLAVSNNYAYSYGAYDKNNLYLPKLLLAAPINSEGVLGNWEIVTEDSGFEFLLSSLNFTSVPILTNKINEVWVAKDYAEAGYIGRPIHYKENNIITRDKIISFDMEGFKEPYLYEYFESEINKDGDIDKTYKREVLNASSQGYITINTVFPTKSKNDNNDRIYVGLAKFWYVEVDKKTGNIIGGFKEESSTIINSQLYVSSGCCSVVTANRVYIFAGNYRLDSVPSSSAPINDDASIGEFTAFSAPDKVESAIITSSRIYVVTEGGIIYWAPFGGGANDYTTYATYGGGPETNTISGRYELAPEIRGTAETVPPDAPFAGGYNLLPSIRGQAETVSAGTVRARYELRPQIAARGGMLRHLNPPGVETGTGDGRSPGYYLRPQIRGKVETAEEDLTRGRWEHPPFTVSGKASLRRQMRGNYVMPLFTVRGAAAGAEPVGDGHWTHPLFHVAGTASLRARHEGYGHYVLPVPRRIRGTMLQEDMDWVLRFRRPEVL